MTTVRKVTSNDQVIKYEFDEIRDLYKYASLSRLKSSFAHEYRMLQVHFKNKSMSGVETGFLINELSHCTRVAEEVSERLHEANFKTLEEDLGRICATLLFTGEEFLAKYDLTDDHSRDVVRIIREQFKKISHSIGITAEIDLLPVADRFARIMHEVHDGNNLNVIGDLAELMEAYHRRVSLIETVSGSKHYVTRGQVLDDRAHRMALSADLPSDIGSKDWWIAIGMNFDRIYYISGLLPSNLSKDSIKNWQNGRGNLSDLIAPSIDTRHWIII